MAYIQRFGINRNTPMNMVAPMKMVGGEDNQSGHEPSLGRRRLVTGGW